MPGSERPDGAAFLLSQLGAVAAARFADALIELDLTPPLAGVLRVLDRQPGLSQQQLADALHAAPSRIVGYVDDLQARGAVQRAPGTDRRVNVVTLTAAGRTLLTAVGKVARAHERSMLAGLSPAQRTALVESLRALAGELGVTRGVHPGFAR